MQQRIDQIGLVEPHEVAAPDAILPQLKKLVSLWNEVEDFHRIAEDNFDEDDIYTALTAIAIGFDEVGNQCIDACEQIALIRDQIQNHQGHMCAEYNEGTRLSQQEDEWEQRHYY